MFRPLAFAQLVCRIERLFEADAERTVTLDELRRWFGDSAPCAAAVAALVNAGQLRWDDGDGIVRADKPATLSRRRTA
jgi:hypothetical protein